MTPLPLLILLPLLQQGAAPEDFRVQDLQAHIGFLACDEMEGRESGKLSGHLAGRYVEAQFRRFGLQPLPGRDDLRIPFTIGRGERATTAYDVVGVLPGTGPDADRYLVIGAHFDHAGIGGPGAMGFPGEIHNGADDNASGTAAMLELAEWYAAHPPNHSLIFIGFSAEERGLNGSRALVEAGGTMAPDDGGALAVEEAPALPLERIDAMLNLDMVGRSEDGYLFVGGLGTAEEFHDLLGPVFERSDLRLELSDLGEAPSDNTSFYHAGIPALFLFTNVHEDYHMPSDDPEKIHYEEEVRILGLAREMVDALDRAGRLTFREAPGMGMPADFQQRMGEHFRRIAERQDQRGRFGVRVDAGGAGLLVSDVSAGSAAEEAGIAPGDRLLRMNGRDLHTIADLRRALGGGMKGDEVRFVLLRDGERIRGSAVLR